MLTLTDGLLWAVALLAVALANFGTESTGRRTLGDTILFTVTTVELAALFLVTPGFTVADWIYVLQHVLVLAIALTRHSPDVRDSSLGSNVAVIIAYTYPYAQVLYLRWVPGYAVAPAIALVLITLAAALSLASLFTLGKRFGVRPALRGLATQGPYRLVRHPMYLSYLLADIGYNVQEWNSGTVALVVLGWSALIYRIRAEERILSQHTGWRAYADSVRYRLLPRLW